MQMIRYWCSLERLELTPILSASLDAFYESGFHGASVREIARRVGVTVPSLYYHHQSKEGLLIALLERSIGDLHSRSLAANAAGDDDPVQRLANVIFTIVLQMTNRALLGCPRGRSAVPGAGELGAPPRGPEGCRGPGARHRD